MTIPRSIVLLQIIKKHLDQYFSRPSNSRMIRSTDLYDYLKRQPDFKARVSSPYAFSRFLRKMHDDGVLGQIIPNVEVDSTNKAMYQWRFYPPTRTRQQGVVGKDISAGSHPGKNNFFANGKIYEADNGVRVRSAQELYILNRLLREEDFDVYYERPLQGAGYEKYPDFTIRNMRTNCIFHWEHFGMLNHPRYDEYMVDKLAWYRQMGYKSIEDGGRLVVTRCDTEDQFIKSVEDVIARLKKME